MPVNYQIIWSAPPLFHFHKHLDLKATLISCLGLYFSVSPLFSFHSYSSPLSIFQWGQASFAPNFFFLLYYVLGASIICTQFHLSSLFCFGGKHHLHPISSLFFILLWGQASFALIFHFLSHLSPLISSGGAGLGASVLCTHSLTFTFPHLAPNHPLLHLIKPKLTSQIFESFV
jgi:hypothetical protein